MTDEAIRQLRELALASTEAARVANETAACHNAALRRAACKRAGVSENYLKLMQAVIDDPLLGAYDPEFERILQRAREKQIVMWVHGSRFLSSPQGLGTGNCWFELGAVGRRIMLDLHGPDWQYLPPSRKLGLAQAA